MIKWQKRDTDKEKEAEDLKRQKAKAIQEAKTSQDVLSELVARVLRERLKG